MNGGANNLCRYFNAMGVLDLHVMVVIELEVEWS